MASSVALNWGILIIGLVISAILYGISCAQTFFYYHFFPKDPLYVRILTGLVFGLSTVHLSFALHVPWYYLVDGAGGNNDNVVVWSWPSSVILTVLISLPVYVYYVRRMRILGTALWMCVIIAFMACAHFALAMAFCLSSLVDNRRASLTLPTHNGFLFGAMAVGSVTDVGIAAVMCWQLWRARTGYQDTDSTLLRIMAYTINTGLLTALCVVAGLICGIAAKNTQLEFFFQFILPELYVNSYLGSLNSREVTRPRACACACGAGMALTTRGGTSTVIHVERATVRVVDNQSEVGKAGSFETGSRIDGGDSVSVVDIDTASKMGTLRWDEREVVEVC